MTPEKVLEFRVPVGLAPELDAVGSVFFGPECCPQHFFEGLRTVVTDTHPVAMHALALFVCAPESSRYRVPQERAENEGHRAVCMGCKTGRLPRQNVEYERRACARKGGYEHRLLDRDR